MPATLMERMMTLITDCQSSHMWVGYLLMKECRAATIPSIIEATPTVVEY